MIWWLWSLLLFWCSFTWGLNLQVLQSTATVGQLASVTYTASRGDPTKFAIVQIFEDDFDYHDYLGPYSDDSNHVTSTEGVFSSNVKRNGVFVFQAYPYPLPINFGGSQPSSHSPRDFPKFPTLIAASDPITVVEESQPEEPPSKLSTTSNRESLADTLSTLPQASVSGAPRSSQGITALVAQSMSQPSPATQFSSRLAVSSTSPPIGAPATSTVDGTSDLSHLSPTSSLNPGSTTITPAPDLEPPPQKDDSLKIILCSVLGALVLLILILILFWIWRPRKYGKTLIQSNWVHKNPNYFQSDASLLDKRFSVRSKSDWDATSLAPSDSISQAHFKVRSLLKKKPLAPSTTLTALSEETESTVVPDLDESKSNCTKLGTELESESGGYGVSRTKVDFEHNNDRDSSTLLLPNPNIPIITKTPATPTPPSTVITAS
ncbi:hypothetical protein K435DRAFT_834568 [Dendrothele bispora CBS 962.96]|uniref:Uncharacterized protein n=1 Tax=Dendrothele bispora (strain CBS 962.96) TaxID=1314807 RepID=A0A4S8MS08_DENBC|nr:hypothetical protein K435DRAFT_834568 [Dendrothele bispora CBS 962.96]